VHANAPAELLAGRYVLREVIGQGGMSQVWRARDQRLDRDVAVKVLHPGLSSTRINRERFEREALAAARINHPNVVSVFDAGQDDGELFIVMECLPGNTLFDEMARGPLEVERARAIGLQLLRGLGAAHALGIVHRDIKPGNVLFAADGSAKLADFGIAKFTEAADLTQTGQMVGTARYLPPERLYGGPATASGDLYALGVVLYEALAGRRPYEGDTPLALVQAIASTTPVPLRSLRADVDPNLAHAVDRAIDKDPDRRFATAAAMSASLIGTAPATIGSVPTAPMLPVTAVMEPAPPRTPPQTPRPEPAATPAARRRVTWLVAVILVTALFVGLVLAAIAAGTADDRPGERQPTTTVAVAPSVTVAPPTTTVPTTTPAEPDGKGDGKSGEKDDGEGKGKGKD